MMLMHNEPSATHFSQARGQSKFQFFAMADPGQDPRGSPDLDPLWLMLDLTPEGRGTDWYPKLQYNHK
jgi:predicted dithiol-disulfide oxidoreductase (DUF899 family)